MCRSASSGEERGLNHPDERVDILRLITRLNIGGPARQALLLTKELGFRSVLAAGVPPREEGELSDPQVHVRRLPLTRELAPIPDTKAIIATRRLIAELKPRLIHTHMAKAGAVGRLATLGVSGRPRCVHTFHGHVLEGYFNPAVQSLFIRAERALAKRADVLIAVSEEIRGSLLELGIGREEQWRVIPLGFDLTSLLAVSEKTDGLRRELRLESGTPLIAVLGRLAPIKDHRTLLRAMVHLPSCHLVIAGDGELRSQLERTVKELNLANVHFLGWRTDVAGLLRDVDLLVLTSRNEGTPVSLIEAHAAARPVVATDVGGVRSVVEDGVTGYLVQVGDEEGIARSISDLLNNPERGREMGRAGRARVANVFSKARLIADIAELYEELLSPRLDSRPRGGDS